MWLFFFAGVENRGGIFFEENVFREAGNKFKFLNKLKQLLKIGVKFLFLSVLL